LGTDYAVQDSKTITPIANALGTETQGQCLSDDVLVGGELPDREKYKCHFTCAKPSVCTDLGSCELPVCDGETSNS
jgi:hypothetical protein